MTRNRILEARLVEWGREYGGGRYEDIGAMKSWLGSMVRWGGRAPTGLGAVDTVTPADDVQAAVEALCAQKSGYIPSIAIRAEYLTPGQPVEMKIERMRKIGAIVGRVGYYQQLRLARVHVAGWLRLPFEELEAPVVYVQNPG